VSATVGAMRDIRPEPTIVPKRLFAGDTAFVSQALLCAELSNTIYQHEIPDSFELSPSDGEPKVLVKKLALHESPPLVGNRRTETAPHWALFRVSDAVVVVFRGTVNAKDMVIDMTYTPCEFQGFPGVQVHGGFYGSLRNSLGLMDRVIAEHLGADEKLYITGHSLGGAYAQLLFLHRKRLECPNATTVMSFGAPMCVYNPRGASGTHECSDEFKQFFPDAELFDRIHCFVHRNDLVPRLLGSNMLYESLRTVMSFLPRLSLLPVNAWRFFAIGAYYHLEGDSGCLYQVDACRNAIRLLLTQVVPTRASVDDHSIALYVTNLRQTLARCSKTIGAKRSVEEVT